MILSFRRDFPKRASGEEYGEACRATFFVERGDSGEGRALSVVLSTSRPGFGLALKETLALALAFLGFFL